MKRHHTTPMLALLALASAPMWAQQAPSGPPPPPPPGGGPMRLESVLDAIDLTAEQSTQIDLLLKARRDAAEAARPGAEAARRALGDQVRAATFDEAAIRAKTAAVAALDAERAVAEAALLRDVRALLTAAQRDKLDRLLEPPARPSRGGGPGPGRPEPGAGRTAAPRGSAG